jgi:hypothetical protein
LFFGYRVVPGFDRVNWADWKWPNAADYEAVFINCLTLNELLEDWDRKQSSDEEGFPRERFDRLRANMQVLQRQLFEVINSNRSVFALCAASNSFNFGEQRSPGVSMFFGASVSTYDWCPLPVATHVESGEVIRDVNPRFGEYRKQLKRWDFRFDDQPKRLDDLAPAYLSRGHSYVLIPKPLFTNLSRQSLGIESRCGIYFTRSREPDQLVEVTGPIYLLHYPLGGDQQEALRVLLREFHNTVLAETQEPAWVHGIKAPHGDKIDRDISALDRQTEALSKQRSKLIAQRQQLERWRRLLYETGDALEIAVKESLDLLRFQNVRLGPRGDHDIVAGFEGETLLFEVKGLTRSVGRRDVFSLDRHIAEFRAKNPGDTVAKGILIANAYRNDPPDTREQGGKQIFSGDAVDHARLLGFALLDTRVLYRIITDVIEGTTTDTRAVMQDLRDTLGVFQCQSR